MPYPTLDSLPDWVKEMPKHAQEIYQAAWNSAFEQYKDEGKAAATAITAVKAKYKKKDDKWVAKEAHSHGEHVCYCPECGHEETVEESEKCNTQTCPECGVQMRAKDIGDRRESMPKTKESPTETLQVKYSELIQELGKRNAAADAERIKKIMAICQDLLSSENAEESAIAEAIKEADDALAWLKEQEVVKTEDGVKFPSEAYAYVPDKEKPSEWRLRLWEDSQKKVTRKQLGAAAAALSPGGFRGQKVDIPSADLPTVKRTIRSAYRGLDVADEEMPRWVREAETRELLADYVPLTEAKFDKGNALITVIKPGFNATKQRYYPSEVLKRDFGIFEGVKMYADHPTETDEQQRPERSIRDWIGTLTKVNVREDGSIIGQATIVEPWMQEKLAILRDKDMLSEMGVSINAVGSASNAEIQGVKTKMVERLIRARSVDFVTEAGAGGGVSLYESVDPHTDIDLVDLAELKDRRADLVVLIESEVKSEIQKEVKRKMELEERVQELEGQVETLTTERDELQGKITEAEKAKAKAEAQAAIKEAVDKAELPDAARERILERFKDAETADGVEEAIRAEEDYIAKLTEAGKVRNLGATTPDPEKSKEALRESFKRMHPNWTDAQLDEAVKGR